MSKSQSITIAEIELENFMLYKKEKIPCRGKDIIGILAQYKEDASRSNRGGKTTIGEAVAYNLQGLCRVKKSSDLIHHGADHMLVTVTYTDGETDFKVKRGVTKKGKSVLEIDWITNQDDAQKEIDRVFGINKEDLYLTNFFKQGDFTGFMGFEPAAKTNFLMRYAENKHWSIREADARKDLNVMKQKLKDNNNLKKALEESLEVDVSLQSILDEKKAELNTYNSEKEVSDKKIASVKAKISTISADRKKLIAERDSLKKEISELEENKLSVEKQKANVTKYENEIKSLNKQIKANVILLSDDESNLQKIRSTATSHIETLTSKIMSGESDQGICPIIKKACSSIKFSEADVKEFKRQRGVQRLDLEKVDADFKTIRENKDYKGQIEVLNHKIETVQKSVKGLPALIKKIDDKNESLNQCRTKLNELNVDTLNEKLNSMLDTRLQIAEKIDALTEEINKLTVKIEKSKLAKTQIDDLVAANEILQKNISIQNHVCFMFSKRGIPAQEIENFFGEIEDTINYCLDDLNVGLQVEFSPDRETREKEPICDCGHEFVKGYRGTDCPECGQPRAFKRVEEINFKIIENNNESSFDLDSGGGKQIVCYAVKIALTYFKKRMNRSNFDVLFLDEADSALDSYLANQIIRSITQFLSKKLGFAQIILVSHKQQIREAVPHILKVTRYKDYSKARFI